MKIKGLCKSSFFVFALIFNFLLSNTPQVLAAPTVIFSALGTGCSTTYTGPYFESNRWVAKTDITIGAINYLFGNQSTSNFSTSVLYIMSDNPTGNYPNAIISTFTPDVISGSGSLTVGRYKGTQSFSAGTKFWIAPSLRANSLPWCYWNGVTTSSLTLNGVVPDTSTSGSNSSFRKVYSSATTLPVGTSWEYSADAAQIWQLSIEAGAIAPTVSLALSGGGRSATFRTNAVLIASTSASSKITFYANKKVIAGCLNLVSSGGTASCNWRPAVIGINQITAKVSATDGSFADFTTDRFDLAVVRRTNTR